MADTFHVAQTEFKEADLPFPPIPEVLKPKLQKLYQLSYGTQTEYPFPAIIDVVNMLEANTLNDYVSVGYFERGVNSYTMKYQFAYRRVLLFMEVLVGGAYADRQANVAGIADQFKKVDRLIDILLPAQESGVMGASEFILIRDDLSAKTWLQYDAGDGFDKLFEATPQYSSDPVSDVIRLLSVEGDS